MDTIEIKKKLESKDINDIVVGFRGQLDITSMLFTQSLEALKENPEWRVFITEKIHEIIGQTVNVLEDSFEREKADDDLKFWLSILLMDYNKLEYSKTVFSYVEAHEDEKETIGLNYLIKKSIPGVNEIILSKLGKMKFEIKTFDRINFYLDKLTLLHIPIPQEIRHRIIEYNEKVEHEWEKLIY